MAAAKAHTAQGDLNPVLTGSQVSTHYTGSTWHSRKQKRKDAPLFVLIGNLKPRIGQWPLKRQWLLWEWHWLTHTWWPREGQHSLGLKLSGGARTAPALSSPGSHVGPGDRQYSCLALVWCVAPCWTSGWGTCVLAAKAIHCRDWSPANTEIPWPDYRDWGPANTEIRLS